MVTISLGPALPTGSSDQPGDWPGVLRPPIRSCSRWGLHGRRVTTPPVRSCRTISPLPRLLAHGEKRRGGMFLLHSPWGRPPWALPSIFARRSSDFPLPAQGGQRPPSRLDVLRVQGTGTIGNRGQAKSTLHPQCSYGVRGHGTPCRLPLSHAACTQASVGRRAHLGRWAPRAVPLGETGSNHGGFHSRWP